MFDDAHEMRIQQRLATGELDVSDIKVIEFIYCPRHMIGRDYLAKGLRRDGAGAATRVAPVRNGDHARAEFPERVSQNRLNLSLIQLAIASVNTGW
jgi:hypothetical protein